jgi:hypothetical protein
MIERLQIYKDTYLLTTKLYAAIPHMDRMHKHLIGSKMIDTSLQLFAHITLANKAKEKAERLVYLNSFLTSFEILRVDIRICSDMKLIKLSTLTDIYLIVENISRQISGWRNATSRMTQAAAPSA